MIPYFVIPPLQIGPVAIQPFGILAAAGVWLASALLLRGARRRGLDQAPLRDFSAWAVFAGVIGGHLVHLLFYHPEELRQGGVLQLLKVWDGLSSTGGVLGGILAAAIFFRARRIPFSRYSDVFALAVAPGWAVARLGCFSVHDHPGRLTSFALALAFPDGARHDLGFYDALVLFALTGLLYALEHRRAFQERLLPVLAVGYGAARFFLDFLRATDLPYSDARYLGLTPAQFAALVLVAYGVVRLARTSRRASGPSASDRDLRRALDLLAAGDWQTAHAIVQEDGSALAAWLHGIVHALEGDLENALYWYGKAQRAFPGREAVHDEIAAALREAFDS